MTAADAITDDAGDLPRVRRMHRHGVVTVLALWLPIFIWMAHLGSMAALVAYVRAHPSRWWVFWLDTGLCAAGVLACMATSLLIGLRAGAPSDAGSPEGRTRFLAWEAALSGLANLALVLAEGSYVAFLSAAAR